MDTTNMIKRRKPEWTSRNDILVAQSNFQALCEHVAKYTAIIVYIDLQCHILFHRDKKGCSSALVFPWLYAELLLPCLKWLTFKNI